MNDYYSCVPIEREGYLFVTGGKENIKSISLLMNKGECVSFLNERKLKRDDRRFTPVVESVLTYLKGETRDLINVPLALSDLARTTFRRRVWERLMAIPRGETVSYKEIAYDIGDESKARAVGQACSANPVAIFIPCHRVLSHNRQLGGYRWGLGWKRKLLYLEGFNFR